MDNSDLTRGLSKSQRLDHRGDDFFIATALSTVRTTYDGEWTNAQERNLASYRFACYNDFYCLYADGRWSIRIDYTQPHEVITSNVTPGWIQGIATSDINNALITATKDRAWSRVSRPRTTVASLVTSRSGRGKRSRSAPP